MYRCPETCPSKCPLSAARSRDGVFDEMQNGLTWPRVAAENYPDDTGKKECNERTPYLHEVNGRGAPEKYRGANDDDETDPSTDGECLTACEHGECGLFRSMAEASTDFHSSCDSNDRPARQPIGRSKVDLIQDDAMAELQLRMCEPVDESARDDHCEPTRSDESQSWKRERADLCKCRSDEVAQS